MRFLLFSDFHYFPSTFKGGEFYHLSYLQARAAQTGCDFIIHAGDFCHGADRWRELCQSYAACPIPSYHVLGNHETDYAPLSEVMSAYGLSSGHYFFDFKGYRMVVLNPNYVLQDGRYLPYEFKNYQGGAEGDHLPPEQLEWLEKTLAESPYPCILISHQSFERPDGVHERAQVRRLIAEANARRPGTVSLCINGHYHTDYLRILDGVCYLDMNSSSYYFTDSTHTLYPPEEHSSLRLLSHTLVYDRPLHAIVTLEDGHIRIDGTRGGYYLGITPERAVGEIADAIGRPISPNVGSTHICLHA